MNNIETIATAGTPGLVLDAARFMRREILTTVDLDDAKNDKIVADVQRLYTAATFAVAVSEDYFTEATRSAVEMASMDMVEHTQEWAPAHERQAWAIPSGDTRRSLRHAQGYISQMVQQHFQPPAFSN